MRGRNRLYEEDDYEYEDNGRLTQQDVYDIAAEVCEEMMAKFLRNLVKLVPDAEEVSEDIQDSYFREMRNMRQGRRTSSPRMQESRQAPRSVDYAPDEIDNSTDEEMAAIAHPASGPVSKDFGIEADVLAQIPLEGGAADFAEAEENSAN